MQYSTATSTAVFVLELTPPALFGLAAEITTRTIPRWPKPVRIFLPSLCALPYLWVSAVWGIFQWNWFALYLVLPIWVSWMLQEASQADPEQKGNWRDAVVLLLLGLAVDLRWFEGAWPVGQAALGKVLLVNVGLYGFAGIRQLSGTGFNLYVRGRDWKTGFMELVFLAPLLIGSGLALGFLHPHANPLRPAMVFAALWAWIRIFLFVAL